LRERLRNLLVGGTQMTVAATRATGAPSGSRRNWRDIEWAPGYRAVRRLQVRIAKAVREERPGRVRALQWLLTHSYHAKLLAVKRVVSNKGRRTPGVDGVLWNTSRKKMQAVNTLTRRGYRSLPLRRIYIPKRNRKLRPLGIPTMRDRAMQALYALSLIPIAETTGDPNSYGFREFRSCADAIGQIFICLAKRFSPRWILEADIRSCFDEINHAWLLRHIPMDRKVLGRWLKSGYLDKGVLYPTSAGTPQGGIISPTLCNMTLDGLEAAVVKAVPGNAKVHVIRYADDFVITGSSEEVLRETVMPVVRNFLAARGLTLSDEKTRITRIEEGFDFLGQHLRRHKEKLIIEPSKAAVRGILAKTKEIINAHRGRQADAMIAKLNPVLRGWANFHRHVCSSAAFAKVDSRIFGQLWRWARRRHPRQGKCWTREHYFRPSACTGWHFFATIPGNTGLRRVVDLFLARSMKILRHEKIQGAANPYDRQFRGYFRRRAARGSARLHPLQAGCTI
ncbi:MAG TPA: group II intron reverse transcriptase/maturase, partial [Nitrospirota bacterium]|nr:group II intron reverse transcriptase/maturase [Nitrospirota bacterium]